MFIMMELEVPSEERKNLAQGVWRVFLDEIKSECAEFSEFSSKNFLILILLLGFPSSL